MFSSAGFKGHPSSFPSTGSGSTLQQLRKPSCIEASWNSPGDEDAKLFAKYHLILVACLILVAIL